MKTLIMPVFLSGKKIPVGSPSMGILMLKKIRSCKNFGGPVKLGFSMWLLVLQSSKGPIVFPMSADGNYFRVYLLPQECHTQVRNADCSIMYR